MKRWICCLLLMGFCLCAVSQALAWQSDQKEQTDGDLPRGYQYILSQDMIYYCVQTEEESFTLFRMGADGTQAERILPLYANSFAISGGFLYFCDLDNDCALTRMKLDGTDKQTLCPFSSNEILAAGEFIYWTVHDSDDPDGRIMRIPRDAPGTVEGDGTYFPAEGAVEVLPVDQPYGLWAHGDWLYYTAYNDGGIGLYRIRGDGTDVQTLYAPEGLNATLNILGFDAETVYFGSWGEYFDGFTCAWTPEGGIETLDLPQCFAYDDGFFYYDQHSNPSLNDNTVGVFRCRAEGSDTQQIATEDISQDGLCGDWLFAEVGGGLNAQAVMLPKDGSASPKTVPGFGVYDCEAHQEESEPEIDWNLEDFGEGDVELCITSYEQAACYRLLRIEGGQTADEVLLVRVDPYTKAYLHFDPGEYMLKIARGDVWISDTEAFGPSGIYSSTEAYSFEAGSYEITIGTVGDFYQDNQQGFMK